jgi:peroxiredoxin
MKNRTIDHLLLVGVIALAALFVGVVANSLNDHVAKEGDRAPKFSIRTDSGRDVTPAEFGGKLLLVNFWATWCPPCVEEMPALDALQRRFAGQGLVVVGISIDTDAAAYHQFLKKYPVSFQTARDGAKKINTDYGTFKVPESYLIDQSGRIVKKVVGKENWTDEHVINYVQSFL